VGGALLLLGVCAAIAVPRIVGTFKHPVDAANIYLADLRDERLPAAYAQLCVLAYGGVSYDQYVERVRAEEAQRGHITRFNAHQVHRVAGHGNEAIVDIDVTTTRGPDAIQARMVNESGRWHWCGSQPAPK
jgi:hypothetical protein